MSRRRGRRTAGQRLVLVGCTALVVAMLAAAGSLAYAYSKYSQVARVELASVLSETVTSDTPLNVLLVGVDSAANLDPDDPVRAGRDGVLRSDTMMILRVDPASDQAHLLSVPRDLWVPLSTGGTGRINTAIQVGGPSALIDTIEGYLGIPVHHYVEVDFAAFRELVDVLDGVEVWFDHPARDGRLGPLTDEAGCVVLDAGSALDYVRSRHYQTLEDGRWRTDPTGDFGRMQRQQDFIARAVRRAVDRGARNPVILDRLIDAGLRAVKVDDRWTAEEMASLANRFRSFDPSRLLRYSLPVADDTVGEAQVLRLLDREARPVLDLFRGAQAGSLAPRDVRVQVLNGTGRAGEAADVAALLAERGFGGAGTGEAERFDTTATIVRFEAGQEEAADLVARHLDPAPVLEVVEGPLNADVVVVTGADFSGVLDTPRPPTSTTSSTTVPGAGEGSATTTPLGSTSEPPPEAEC